MTVWENCKMENIFHKWIQFCRFFFYENFQNEGTLQIHNISCFFQCNDATFLDSQTCLISQMCSLRPRDKKKVGLTNPCTQVCWLTFVAQPYVPAQFLALVLFSCQEKNEKNWPQSGKKTNKQTNKQQTNKQNKTKQNKTKTKKTLKTGPKALYKKNSHIWHCSFS